MDFRKKIFSQYEYEDNCSIVSYPIRSEEQGMSLRALKQKLKLLITPMISYVLYTEGSDGWKDDDSGEQSFQERLDVLY